MNIVFVTIDQDHAIMASWLVAQDFSGCTPAHWQIELQPTIVEQALDAPVEQWQRTPAGIALSPPGALDDKLVTRLAWRVYGTSTYQVISFDISTASVRKSHREDVLTATSRIEERPLYLSLTCQVGADKNAMLSSEMRQLNIVSGAPSNQLTSVKNPEDATRDPLAEAKRVLMTGQGGEADNQEIVMPTEKMGVEVGCSRARVMNGGIGVEKVIGIFGHLPVPEVCIIVGASDAAVLMAGIRSSKFVVAINHDTSAAVSSQADIDVADGWKAVLEILVTNIHADCQQRAVG